MLAMVVYDYVGLPSVESLCRGIPCCKIVTNDHSLLAFDSRMHYNIQWFLVTSNATTSVCLPIFVCAKAFF